MSDRTSANIVGVPTMGKVMKYLILAILGLISLSSQAAIDWNESEIKWHGYVDGLVAAREQNKNAVLIVYAEWCAVCTEYSSMFRDQRVVSRADNVIFIKLDQDDDSRYLKRFSIDGEYVPRTYLLDRNQDIMVSHYANDTYLFFLSPGNASYFSRLLDRLK